MTRLFCGSSFNNLFSSYSYRVGSDGVDLDSSLVDNFNGSLSSFVSSFFSLVAARIESSGEGNSE